MSRLAMEVEKRAKELRSKPAQKSAPEPSTEGEEYTGADLQSDRESVTVAVETETVVAPDAAPGSQPETVGEADMTKKKHDKKAKAGKQAKSAKGGSKKRGRGPREVSGALVDVKAGGLPGYVAFIFEQGSVNVLPSSNRGGNQTLLVKTLKALLKS